jgi:hypothetical protein
LVCLRQHRHALCVEVLQQALLMLSHDHPQASIQVSADEVIEATTMERRWPWVLECLDAETPPVSQGTLVAFRQRLIAQLMDHRLLERTVEVAATSGAFGLRQVRAALERSPLWGAGRVEETAPLVGHARRKAVGVIARRQGRGRRAVAAEAGARGTCPGAWWALARPLRPRPWRPDTCLCSASVCGRAAWAWGDAPTTGRTAGSRHP